MYKISVTKNGRIMYYLDGKLVSRKSIPEDVVRMLELPLAPEIVRPNGPTLEADTTEDADVEVTDFAAPVEAPPAPVEPEVEPEPAEVVAADPEPVERGVCIFCGASSTDPKWVNGQAIDLCETHYHTKTTGEVVKQLRETA